MNTPLKLQRFQEELEAIDPGNAGVHFTTFYRYRSGDFPKAVYWLIERPQLLRALAADAEALQQQLSPIQQEAA